MNKYSRLYPKSTPFHVRDTTADDLSRAVGASKASCGGLDGWQPSDFRLLGKGALGELAFLLNRVEETGVWPEALQEARGVALANTDPPPTSTEL